MSIFKVILTKLIVNIVPIPPLSYHPEVASADEPGWETAQQLTLAIKQKAGPDQVSF